MSSGKTYYLYNAKNQLLDSAPAGYMIPTDCVRFLMPGNVSDWNHLSYFEINNGNVVKYGLANLTITNTTNYTYSTYKEIYPNIYTKVNATEFVYDYSADAHRIYDTFGV
ncbi:MAG: hypothetical protein LBT10_04810 [Methanobrevibacter sp.]|nr:hypothetical protein [Methanobrevibacter sp.]